MGILSRKTDPIANAEAAVARLEANRDKLAARLTTATAAVESAQRSRREALISDDPDPRATAALDLACSRAAESKAGVEEAMRDVALQLEEAVRHRDDLQDAAVRARVAADSERRADALDAAAETLAAAAGAFNHACRALVTAVEEHGAEVENVLSTNGRLPPMLVARPVIAAALKIAAAGTPPIEVPPPGQTVVNEHGVDATANPLSAMRSVQSGRLRDHAETVKSGSIPAVDLPRPGTISVVDENNPLLKRVEKVRGAIAERLCWLGESGLMVHGEAGNIELPVAVFNIANANGIAADLGTREAAAILRETSRAPVPAYLKTQGQAAQPFARFVDLDTGTIQGPTEGLRPASEIGNDAREEALLPYYSGRLRF